MVIGERTVHHGSGHDLAINNGRTSFYCICAHDGTLRWIYDRCPKHATSNAAVCDAEGCCGHVLHCELVLGGFLHKPC